MSDRRQMMLIDQGSSHGSGTTRAQSECRLMDFAPGWAMLAVKLEIRKSGPSKASTNSSARGARISAWNGGPMSRSSNTRTLAAMESGPYVGVAPAVPVFLRRRPQALQDVVGRGRIARIRRDAPAAGQKPAPS
jgi:hypothetical protein